jgi:hypothetical protein
VLIGEKNGFLNSDANFFDSAPKALFGVYPIAAIAEAVPLLHQLGSGGFVYRFVDWRSEQKKGRRRLLLCVIAPNQDEGTPVSLGLALQPNSLTT